MDRGQDSGVMGVSANFSPGAWGKERCRPGRAGESQSDSQEEPGQPGPGVPAGHNLQIQYKLLPIKDWKEGRGKRELELEVPSGTWPNIGLLQC